MINFETDRLLIRQFALEDWREVAQVFLGSARVRVV
jgi:hypothetical protein